MKSSFRDGRRIAAAALFALVAWLGLGTTPAGASGTVTIQQRDGHVNQYHNVAIKIIHDALFVTSPDGAGTLVIHRAACSYDGDLLVCFATSATLIQAGKTSPLDFKQGTVYVNDTDAALPLVLSTVKVAPHSIVLSLTTKRGTYVSLNGRIDQVVK